MVGQASQQRLRNAVKGGVPGEVVHLLLVCRHIEQAVAASQNHSGKIPCKKRENEENDRQRKQKGGKRQRKIREGMSGANNARSVKTLVHTNSELIAIGNGSMMGGEKEHRFFFFLLLFLLFSFPFSPLFFLGGASF